MENKNQVGGGGSSHASSSSSRTLDHLFGPKDSSSSSSSSLFGSIFPPPPSAGLGSSGKYGNPSALDNQSQGFYSSKGESTKGQNTKGASKDSMIYQNEAVEPCNFSSSIYYGGQENYSPRTGTTTESHQHHLCAKVNSADINCVILQSKKDGGDDDANGNNSNCASRGNWWKGSLYY
ncbi:unnamed protein product [Prunus armeniaca]|uniref:Uncharacterized protein n=1 Tax=Prunus armeniaca TaxID=36596 RepID=A0A6J5U3Q7_PRUAR|nr:unnamed protein product [Prunus armeniaca]